MKKLFLVFLFIVATLPFFSCEKDEVNEPMLVVKFVFDDNQVRLNNLGQPSAVALCSMNGVHWHGPVGPPGPGPGRGPRPLRRRGALSRRLLLLGSPEV